MKKPRDAEHLEKRRVSRSQTHICRCPAAIRAKNDPVLRDAPLPRSPDPLCSTAPSPTCSPHPLSPSRQQIAPNCCHRAGEGQHSEGRAVIGTHPVQSCRGQPQWRGSGEAPCLRSTVTFAHPSIPSTVCKQWSHSWDRYLKIKSRHKLQVQTQELTYGMITL